MVYVGSAGLSTSFYVGHNFFLVSKSHLNTVFWGLFQGIRSCVKGECPHFDKLPVSRFIVLLQWDQVLRIHFQVCSPGFCLHVSQVLHLLWHVTHLNKPRTFPRKVEIWPLLYIDLVIKKLGGGGCWGGEVFIRHLFHLRLLHSLQGRDWAHSNRDVNYFRFSGIRRVKFLSPFPQIFSFQISRSHSFLIRARTLV